MDVLALRSANPTRLTAPKLLRVLGPATLVAIAYYAGCLAGFALRFPDSGISFFWPPTAVLTAALMLVRPHSWPSLMVGALLAHAVAHTQDGLPMTVWSVQFLGNASQALLATWFVNQYSSARLLFADARRVLAFIVGASLVAPAVASLIPAYLYVSMGWASDFAQAWRARAVSNAIASLTLVPSLVVLWLRVRDKPLRITPRAIEYGLLLGGVVAAHVAMASIERTDVLALSAALYAPAPFLLWATVRFGGAGLSVALLWTTLLTISTVLAGYGPFARGTAADTVVGVQLLIAANAIPMMVIAGLLAQNRREHRALEDAEQQNSAILRAVPDVMFVQTRDGVYLRCYAREGDNLAVDPGSFVGRHLRDVLPSELAAMFARALESATAETPSVIEFSHLVGGVACRYEGRFIAIDNDRVLSVVRDITDRWRSENALRATQQRYTMATAAGGIGVWELAIVTGEICVEGNLRSALGYDQHEVGNQIADWLALVCPADRGDVESRLKSLMSGASDVFETECRIVHWDGSLRWFSIKGAVTEWADGAPLRATGTYADITERHESARALREATDALTRTDRLVAVAEFSASIAHELNQPLTALSTNASTCLRWIDADVPLAAWRDVLGDVVNDSLRASQIIERTQKMFSNRPVQKAELDLNDVVRSVVTLIEPRLRECHALLELDLHEPLPHVMADSVQLQQVLLNLIVNALDAMRDVNDGGRVLHIRSRPAKQTVVVSVRDTGHGFEAEDEQRVFEPFYTTKAAGTGMGLTISRSIVEGHGGSLWAVSNRDRGVTFRFKVPSIHSLDEERAVSSARRVLIVDDHDELRTAMMRLVRTWGHDVADAADGVSALSVTDTFRPEVAVVDISLPDMTGLELAKRLREAHPVEPLQLIALTAHRGDDLRDQCLAAGFDAYLVKPGGVSQLERILARSA
jgi:PAS domain S-box-containing protein